MGIKAVSTEVPLFIDAGGAFCRRLSEGGVLLYLQILILGLKEPITLILGWVLATRSNKLLDLALYFVFGKEGAHSRRPQRIETEEAACSLDHEYFFWNM